MPISEISGQDARQFIELGLAFFLSALIGLEREIRHKSAGLRTYTVVGTAAALFVLISKYGFTDVLIVDRIVLDPSRVAAQIVSGIGFIGDRHRHGLRGRSAVAGARGHGSLLHCGPRLSVDPARDSWICRIHRAAR
jgi:hypothetical protein